MQVIFFMNYTAFDILPIFCTGISRGGPGQENGSFFLGRLVLGIGSSKSEIQAF